MNLSPTLRIIGSSSAVATRKRNHTAQLFQFGNEAVLIDCGEGTFSNALRLGIRMKNLTKIFISHLHLDHCQGLFGVLSSFSLFKRTQPIHLYAPIGIKKMIETQMEISQVYFSYDVIIHELTHNGKAVICTDRNLTVSAFPIYHSIPCYGYIFKVQSPSRKIIPEKLALEKLSPDNYSDLVSGKDTVLNNGKILLVNDCTTPSPIFEYAFVTDTYFDISIAKYVEGVHTLYHEATYDDSFRVKAKEMYHSTALQAAKIAKISNVQRLILGHYSARYDTLDVLLDEAQTIFPNTFCAEEGKSFNFEPKP